MLSLIPAPYRWLAGALAILAAVGGLWLAVARYDAYQQGIGYDRAMAAWGEAKIRDNQAALQKERQLQKDKNDAEQQSAVREARLRADYAAAHAAALGLRDTVANLRGHLASAPVEACRETAAAALAVFGECTAQLGAVAEAADGHASDVETLSAAWPK